MVATLKSLKWHLFMSLIKNFRINICNLQVDCWTQDVMFIFCVCALEASSLRITLVYAEYWTSFLNYLLVGTASPIQIFRKCTLKQLSAKTTLHIHHSTG